jgi:hypothetical protein
MTAVVDIECTLDADPLGTALSDLRVALPRDLRGRVLSRADAVVTRPRGGRRSRVVAVGAVAVAGVGVVALSPAGPAIARSLLPDGMQQRLGLVEGAPRNLTPPGGAKPVPRQPHAPISPMPCSAVPTP